MAAVTVVSVPEANVFGKKQVLLAVLTIANTNTWDVGLSTVQGIYFGSPDHLVTSYTKTALSSGGTRITFAGSATAVPLMVIGT